MALSGAILKLGSEDSTSILLDLSSYNTQGLCNGFSLRIHAADEEANKECHRALADWQSHVGPMNIFGCCNTIDGNFTSLTMPLVKPERLGLIAYIFEYAFYYDEVLESAAQSAGLDPSVGNLILKKTDSRFVKSIDGCKRMQEDIISRLVSMDPECGRIVLKKWRNMVETTSNLDRSQGFKCVDEYVEFRIIDCGAPFVDSVMLFGMGLILTEQEKAKVAHIVKSCHAVLALTNDYFSFDVEYEKYKESGSDPLFANIVWLFMKWHDIKAKEAKRWAKTLIIIQEKRFLEQLQEYRAQEQPVCPRIAKYLAALAYEIPGNTVWSLKCPRYNPKYRVYQDDLVLNRKCE